MAASKIGVKPEDETSPESTAQGCPSDYRFAANRGVQEKQGNQIRLVVF